MESQNIVISTGNILAVNRKAGQKAAEEVSVISNSIIKMSKINVLTKFKLITKKKNTQ